MPRRAVGASVLVERWGQSGFGRVSEMPRRARGGQSVSAVQSDNGCDHRAAAKDLQAIEKTNHRRSGASHGYPPYCPVAIGALAIAASTVLPGGHCHSHQV